MALETVDNARVSIAAAESVGARDVAVSEINLGRKDANQCRILFCNPGDVERAYRLGLRAYLHARIATEKSLAVRQEAQVKEAQAELELRQQATEEVLNNLEKLKAEQAAQKE